MQIPKVVKDIVWALYPPRYRQLADKSFSQSLWHMSKILFIAFLISSVLFMPKLFTLKGMFEDELGKFDSITFSGNITQSAPLTIPHHQPWVVIDVNSNISLSKELFIIDQDTVQYRFMKPKSIPREQLKSPAEYRPRVSGFLTALLILLLPGIALLLYLRMWVKYFLLILVGGTVFFIIMELTRFRLKWVQMLNIAAHALTVVILIEVISAAIYTEYLIQIMRFLGVNIYALTLGVFAVFMVLGIVGYKAKRRRK